MRISDWSSDVCSSDLGCRAAPPVRCPSAAQSTARRASRRRSTQAWRRIRPPVWPSRAAGGAGLLSQSSCAENALALGSRREAPAKSTWNLYADQAHIRGIDRKSVVSGTRVSVRVDLGGRRIIKKKKNNHNSTFSHTYKKTI